MDGRIRYVGSSCVDSESKDSWRGFLLDLRQRSVRDIRLVVSDAHAELRQAIREVFPRHLPAEVPCPSGAQRPRHDRDEDELEGGRGGALSVFRGGDPAIVHAAFEVDVREIGTIDRLVSELLEDAREDMLC